MRFILCFLIWLIIVGGLWLYTDQRDAAVSAVVVSAVPDRQVAARFAIELTPTFTVEEDPFALQVSDSPQSLLEVRLNSILLDLGGATMLRGTPLSLHEVQGVLEGHNEIYVKASPPLAENRLIHGIRIRVLGADRELLDDTVWSEGGLVSGSVTFAYRQTKGAGHDQ